LYAYVRNNPANTLDPDGLQAVTAAGCAAAGPAGCAAGGAIDLVEILGGLVLGGLTYSSIKANSPPTPDNSSERVERGLIHPKDPNPGVPARVNPGRGCGGKCLPCPPIQVGPWSAPGNSHGATNGMHWHWFEWNQNPKTCECFLTRM